MINRHSGDETIDEQAFFNRGWYRFAPDHALTRWIAASLPAARRAVTAPENAEWLRCGGTWFAGVNALPNDATGAVANGVAVAGEAVDFVHQRLGLTDITWDRAQVSVVYPGYPQPMDSETAVAYRFRRDRDAAHIDGVLRSGPAKRRFLREHHAFILGIPMAEASANASPLVLWEGSHDIVRRTFSDFFRDIAAERWHSVDITGLYSDVRRQIFAACRRITLPARPGEAYLVHRLALHGIAPWHDAATAGPDGRMIAYFRPDLGNARQWLTLP